MKKLTFQQKYNTIGTKNSYYEGIFITAVKTTGIFCRPSCRARKPNIENVVFYDTPQEALQNGFRPCKICKPMEQLDETPKYITMIIEELHKNPYLKIKDYDLKQRNIEPNHIRRWFKKYHNMTFHAYQRMLRINSVFSTIQKGGSVSDSAFENGYESLSGFNENYRAIFGLSPSQNSTKSVINIIRFATPIGPMFACASNQGLCLLEFTDRRKLETEFTDLQKKLNVVILPGENTYLDQVQTEIREYFAGTRRKFSIALHTPGTDFQNLAWRALNKIPYGETRSYTQQALILGKPKAHRAVATANGHNRIAIIIPCHRVIAADGKLAGYAGGLHRKKWLIDFEKSNSK